MNQSCIYYFYTFFLSYRNEAPIVSIYKGKNGSLVSGALSGISKTVFDIALVAKSIDPLSTTIFRCNEFTDREKRVGDYF